jgi:hypothetical protein
LALILLQDLYETRNAFLGGFIMKKILFTFAIILVSSFAVLAQKGDQPKPTPRPNPPVIVVPPKPAPTPKPDKPSSVASEILIVNERKQNT